MLQGELKIYKFKLFFIKLKSSLEKQEFESNEADYR